MATTSEIVSRLTLNAKEFTARFDAAIDQATARAREGGRQIGSAFSSTAGDGLRSFAGQVPGVGGALTGLSGAALGAAAGIGALAAGVGFALANTEEYAQAARGLDAVLKATGNQTGFTSEQLKEYAETLESTLAISAESILGAQKVLASFDGVAGTTFKRAITSAADLAAVYGGDLSSNSEKLGVVLQNLAEGNVAGLSKGFKFLGETTLGTIEQLAKTGRTAEAQTALLDALEKKIGGSGETAGQGVAGAFFRLSDSVGDLSRSFAEQSGLYTAVVSGLDAAAAAASRYADKISNLNGLQLTGEIFKATSPLYQLGRLTGVVGADASSGSTAAGLAARDNILALDAKRQKSQEDERARLAAASAKARGDEARAAEAAAEAGKKAAAEGERQAKAAEAAAKAIERQKAALTQSVDDLKFQNTLIGKSADEAAKLTKLRQLELQNGKLFTAELRAQVVATLDAGVAARGVLAARQEAAEASLEAGRRYAEGLVELSKAEESERDRVREDDKRKREADFRYLSDAFYDVFSGRSGNIWGKFKELGARTLAELASQFALTGKIDIGGTGAGKLLGGVGSALGIKSDSGIGKVIGDVLPYAGLAAGVFSLVSGIFKKDDFSDARLSTSGSGVSASGVRTRGDASAAASSSLVGAVSQGLQQLASALGTSVQAGVSLGSIGTNKDTFYYNPTGGDFKAAGRQSYATAEEAASAAIGDAVRRGALSGVDAGIAKLLSQGDLATQTGKAQLLASALKEFNTGNDPTIAAVAALNEQFAQLRDVMAEAGSSAEDVAKASALYDSKLQDIRASAGQATTTLKAFLDDLGFGSASPLALGDQAAAARAAYGNAAAGIGSGGFDQQAFVAAGQRLLDIEGQINGRTQDFFATFNQVQADTNRAIGAITNASAINGDNPFARRTADATAATADNTASLLQSIDDLPARIAAVMAQYGGGGGFIGGDGRGFVANAF